MPVQQAVCVLLVYASVMGIVLAFGRAMWILTWQSIHNFPFIRRLIAYECRPQAVVLTITLPMVVLLLSLLLVPPMCHATSTTTSAEIDDLDTAWYSSAYSSAVTQQICEDSYLKFLTDKYPVFQRSMRLATILATYQVVQGCLEILPPWSQALAGLSARATYALGMSLVAMNVVGAMWTVEWVARHFDVQLTPLSALNTADWEQYGMLVLLLWVLWFSAVTLCTYDNVHTYDKGQRGLRGLFERLKYIFVVGQAIIFTRACVLPSMGFVHAQLELTVVNLLLPLIYVFSLIVLRIVSLVTVKSVLVSAPLAVGFYGAKMTHRHALVAVTVFLFDLLLRWSDAVFFQWGDDPMGRVRHLLQHLFTAPTAATVGRKDLFGHSIMRRVMKVAFAVFALFVGALCGFGLLSAMQQSTNWFPDATTVTFGPDGIAIQHATIVKLHLGFANASAPPMTRPKSTYAACASQWNGLSLVDYALLAEAAYLDPTSDAIDQFVGTLFGGGHQILQVVVRTPQQNSKTGSKINFFEAFFPALNTSVVSVKGTDIWRFTDFIEDVKMWFEPVVFTILSGLFPTIRIWPDATSSTMIELFNEVIALFGLQHESWYYHELLEYVASIEDRDVVLTGHSMGGGIARLVGSIAGKTSVTFSPPGFVQSYSKLVHTVGGQSMKVDRDKLHHWSVTVIPGAFCGVHHHQHTLRHRSNDCSDCGCVCVVCRV